jgi:KipI family sensor histidine kinase inhibitor
MRQQIMIYESPRYLYSGDQYVTVEIGDEMTLKANFKVIGLDRTIKQAEIDGIIETFPGWRSLMVHYDNIKIKTADLIDEVQRVIEVAPEVKEVPSRLIELPVKYGGKYAPDLDFVAKENNMSPEEVIRIHSQTIHWVGMVGFTPGSPQLMQLDPSKLLSVRKYLSPRLYTPKGAIALGGSITAIYPVVSPGGYQMMGLTPVPIFDRYQSLEIFDLTPVLLRIGDRVRFKPVNDDGFDTCRQQVWEYSYKYIIKDEKFALGE